MGVLEARQPKGRAPMGGYWLACEVSRSLTLRGEQALIFWHTKRSKSHQDNQGNETNCSSRPATHVCKNELSEWKKKRQLRVCSGSLPIYCREWLGVCTWCRQFSEVKVGRERTLRTGLGSLWSTSWIWALAANHGSVLGALAVTVNFE